MKFAKPVPPVHPCAVLLDYNQTMYFSSIQEVLAYVVTSFNQSLAPAAPLQIFPNGPLDEYNRIIIADVRMKLLRAFRARLMQFGIATTVGLQDDPVFQAARLAYIKYKFCPSDPALFAANLENNHVHKLANVLHYEPIILAVDPFVASDSLTSQQKIIFISYYQTLSWTKLQQALQTIAKRHRRAGVVYIPTTINKYNRRFYSNSDETLVWAVVQSLAAAEVLTVVLDDEAAFVSYRLDYIRHYYPAATASFLHAKWRLEYANGWFSQEPWPPLISLLTLSDPKCQSHH